MTGGGARRPMAWTGPMQRREFIRGAAAAALATSGAGALLASCSPSDESTSTALGSRGHLLVTLDDMNDDELEYMPYASSLREQGTTFVQARVGTAVCSPARASTLMGQKAVGPNGHGVLNQTGVLGADQRELSLPVWLEAEGVVSMVLGKWFVSLTRHRQPGWTSMRISTNPKPAHAVGFSIYDSDQDLVIQPSGRQEDYLRDETIAFVEAADAAGNDWYVWLNLHEPHYPYTPSDEALAQHLDVQWPYDPDEDVSAKPAWVRGLEPLTPSAVETMRRNQRGRLQELVDADKAIRGVHEALGERATLWITSDNGLSRGEHHVVPLSKGTPYDVSAKVPLVVVGPGFRAGFASHVPVSSPEDIVATIADDFGVTPLVTTDGESLRDVIETNDLDRRCWGGGIDGDAGPGGPEGMPACDWIVGRDAGVLYKYIRYPSTEEIELYDIDADPGELVNLAGDEPAAVATLDADLDTALGIT